MYKLTNKHFLSENLKHLMSKEYAALEVENSVFPHNTHFDWYWIDLGYVIQRKLKLIWLHKDLERPPDLYPAM